jgi:hypothetical protein
MQRKTKRLHLRVEPGMKEKLEKEAEELGCSVSDLIRVRSGLVASPETRIDPGLYQQLEGIIAKAIREALGGI